MITFLYILGFYFLGVILAVFLAKLYNKRFAFTSHDEPNDEVGIVECFLSWFTAIICLLVIGFKLFIFLLEAVDNWLKN